MRNIYILALSVLGLTSVCIAQKSNSLRILNTTNYNETIPQKPVQANGILRATQNCTDTVDYALYVARDFGGQVTSAALILEDSTSSISGTGIFFPVPTGQSVTISGIEFLAYGLKANGSSSQAIISVYEAGADSTPTGNAIQTQTVSIDTNSYTYGDIYHVVTFNPTLVNSSFVITVEAGSPTDSLIQITGGINSVGGRFDGFPTNMAIGGNWIRLASSNILGILVPRIHPIISYNANNSISANITQFTMANELVNFTTTSPTIAESYLSYSGMGTRGNANTSSIDFGDGNSVKGSQQNPSHTYVDPSQNYTITLTDTIILYQSTGKLCTLSETISILKADPTGINESDNGKFFAFSSPGQITIGNGTGRAVLYTSTGRIVKQVTLSNPIERVNVAELPQGVYILQVGNKVVKLTL